MSVNSILPQSSSDIDTDQSDIIDETIKQVAQSVNQTLLKTSTGNPTSNLTLNDSPHDRIPSRQSVLVPNPSDIHIQTNIQPAHTYRPASSINNITHSVTNFEQAEQILKNTDTLSHSPSLCNKILQE